MTETAAPGEEERSPVQPVNATAITVAKKTHSSALFIDSLTFLKYIILLNGL